MHRLKITLDDLKARVFGEPFVFHPFRPLSEVKQILIVENQSTFHSCKRILKESLSLLGFKPDLLVYGEAEVSKKIINTRRFQFSIYSD